MEAEQVRRREPCSEHGCGSRRFYVADDGYTYCDRGHRQSHRGTVVSHETGELIRTGKTSKRIDSDAESVATSRSGFTQEQVDESHMLCLQLVLRKQIAWLVSIQRFPAETEAVLKDLFALRIQHFRSGVHHADTDDERSQLFSSQSGTETGTETEGTKSRRSRRSKRDDNNDHKEHMSVLDLIALIQISILLMRLPISTADLCHWVSEGDLPYYFSMRIVPESLARRLPQYAYRLLTPESVLTGEALQVRIWKTISKFSKSHGMQVPAINHLPLLYRWLKRLCLPIEAYAATKALIKLLQQTFDYELNAYAGITRLPETRLIACIVLATILIFPVHDEVIQLTPTTLSALRLDWDDWYRSQPIFTDSHTDCNFEKTFSFTESDCFEMSDQAIDQYLDWYQENIASEYIPDQGYRSRDADFRRAMLGLFPHNKMAGNSTSQLRDKDQIGNTVGLRHVQQQLRPRPTDHADQRDPTVMADEHLVGARYYRYRSEEELLAAPPATSKLYKLAAQLSGASIALLTRTVYTLSKRLEQS